MAENEINVSGDPTPLLIERFQAGDRESYGVLIRRYEQPLRRFICRHTDDSLKRIASVEDLLQETHVEAIAQLQAGRFTYRRELSFFFWSCAIARHRIARHYRKARREIPASRRLPTLSSSSPTSVDILSMIRSSSQSPLEEVSLRENVDLLATALATLPQRRQDALILRYFEMHDTAKAAQLMQVKPGTFRVLLSRSLVQLRDALANLLGEEDAELVATNK